MTHYIPDRQWRSKSGAFVSKVDGFSRAKRYWMCDSCGMEYMAKVPKCGDPKCAGRVICLASRAEAKRFGQLLVMQRYGDIVELYVHPRFPCRVEGQLVCTYIADFRYVDRADNAVVEDVKGNKDRTDSASALRRKLAEAIHHMTVKIVEV